MSANTDNTTTIEQREEIKTGVTVTVKSKRGSGTRDQDTVTLKAHYDDLTEAGDRVKWLNSVLNYQLDKARRTILPGIETTDHDRAVFLDYA